MEAEEIKKQLSEKYGYDIAMLRDEELTLIDEIAEITHTTKQKSVTDEDYTNQVGFWKRLKSFVIDIRVSDAMGQEEKDMIFTISDGKIDQLSTVSKEKPTEQKTEVEVCIKCEGTGRDGHDRCDPPNWYICQGCGGTGY